MYVHFSRVWRLGEYRGFVDLTNGTAGIHFPVAQEVISGDDARTPQKIEVPHIEIQNSISQKTAPATLRHEFVRAEVGEQSVFDELET